MTTFDLEQTEEIGKFIEEHLQEAVSRGMMSAAMRIIGIIQNEIIPAANPPPILNRHYASGWIPEVQENGDIHIKNTMPYASIIEFGARPENIKIGRAMIQALTEWVVAKGFVGRPKTALGRSQAVINAQSIAWAIARTMQGTDTITGKGIFNRNGEKGLRIAEKAAKRAPAIVRREVAREVRKMLK